MSRRQAGDLFIAAILFAAMLADHWPNIAYGTFATGMACGAFLVRASRRDP